MLGFAFLKTKPTTFVAKFQNGRAVRQGEGLSFYSRADMVAGILEEDERLQLESMMSENGIIFSDGIESDGIDFNSGSIATVRFAQQFARLVVS